MQASSPMENMPYMMSKADKEIFNMMGKGRERRSKSINQMQPVKRFHKQNEESKIIPTKQITIKDFNIIENIGSGSFGTVYVAELRGKKYAVKELDKDKILRVITSLFYQF